MSVTQPRAATELPAKPMPKLWIKFSVRTGTLIQLAVTAAGCVLLGLAANLTIPHGAKVALMIVGWLAIYLNTHAIGHVAVGQAVGIRFRAYGVRGTDHPENYPPGVRQIMSVLPMWSALTRKDSMRSAGRGAKAAMFAAGETATTIASIAAGAYADSAGIPGGRLLLIVSIVWAVAASITVSIVPKGDYAKALRALGWRQPANRPASDERSYGPDRRPPREKEVRNAALGWGLVNLVVIALWAANGAGFPWFLFILVPSTIGVGSWALQGRKARRLQ